MNLIEKLKAKRLKVDTPVLGTDPNMTINQLGELFLKDAMDTLKPKTIRERERVLRVWILPTIGNMPVREVRSRDIQPIIDKAYSNSVSTLDCVSKVIKTMFIFAAQNEYGITESPINDHCKKGICVKKKFGVLAGSKGNYPELTNLKKIELDPEPEFEFDVIKSDGFTTATVHCKTVEHVTDQRKRRNSISKAAGFAPPIIKGDKDQIVLDALWKSEKIVNPPIGTSSREKLHDVLHAKINGPKAMNDAGFKTGTVLIEEGYAFFKFDKFYDKLKSKNWKYSEDKTGVMMKTTYQKCEIRL